MSSRAELIEKTEKKKTRTASCTIASLPRVKESPVATTDRSGMDKVSGREDGKHRADKRVSKTIAQK